MLSRARENVKSTGKIPTISYDLEINIVEWVSHFTDYILLSADNLCKPFGPSSGPTKRRPSSVSKIFGTRKKFSKNIFRQKSADGKQKHAKLHSGRVNQSNNVYIELYVISTHLIKWSRTENINKVHVYICVQLGSIKQCIPRSVCTWSTSLIRVFNFCHLNRYS